MVEALYFNTLYSFLRGDLESTRMYFDFLKEESKIKNIKNILEMYQLRKLKEIRQAIDSGIIAAKKFIEQEFHAEEKFESDVTLKQTDVVKRIHEDALEDLKEFTKDPSISLYNIEHPCSEYGKVDMVYMGDSICYPLEVKIREGRHDLIGQIDKYTKHFLFQLHYKHYKDVCGVTVCRSYEGHVLDELKRADVLPLKYYFIGKKLRIKAA